MSGRFPVSTVHPAEFCRQPELQSFNFEWFSRFSAPVEHLRALARTKHMKEFFLETKLHYWLLVIGIAFRASSSVRVVWLVCSLFPRSPRA